VLRSVPAGREIANQLNWMGYLVLGRGQQRVHSGSEPRHAHFELELAVLNMDIWCEFYRIGRVGDIDQALRRMSKTIDRYLLSGLRSELQGV